MLYIVNLHTDVYQSFLNKTGSKSKHHQMNKKSVPQYFFFPRHVLIFQVAPYWLQECLPATM